MPCSCDFTEPTAREEESSMVLEFLKEIEGKRFNHESRKSLYGRIKTLDEDTAKLCDWCGTHDVAKYSLELQLWWRKHQAADKRRMQTERIKVKEKLLKDGALAKLTEPEKKALGLI